MAEKEELFVYVGKSRSKYKAAFVTCATCGKKFLKAIKRIKLNKNHYCCPECEHIGWHNLAANNNKEKAAKWVAEKHVCEHCGKVMTEKFGSGRFCSRACANAKNFSAEVKAKISNTLKLKPSSGGKVLHLKTVEAYNKAPRYCKVCGKPLPYEKRHCKCCSKECRTIAVGQAAAKTNLNKKRSKHGTYKSFYCDSSYELAFVVYCLEHNIQIERNKKSFPYQFNGETHNYYPDFIINGDTYIEIKNYRTEQVQAKIDAMPKDIKYQILYKADMKKYLDYCIAKYGKDFYQKLYNS